MGIRDWLAIIVIIFIVLILLDGFRRKWLERKNRIVVKIDRNIPPPDESEDDAADPLIRSELPNGGARTIRRADGSFYKEKTSQDVPVLMEPVDLDDDFEEYASDELPSDDTDLESWQENDQEQWDDDIPEISQDISGSDISEEELEDEPEGQQEGDQEDDAWTADDDFEMESELDQELEDYEEDDDSEVVPAKKGMLGSRSQREERIEPTFGDQDLTFSRDDQGELDLEHNDLIDSDTEHEEDNELEQAEEVIIINVMANPGTMIEGKKLLAILLKNGMRLGEMSIFHRHADSSGKGPVMFSMANMLKPGTFSMSEMDEFETLGVSFFMQLPNKLGNMACFEQMLKTAEALKNEMDVLLKDENRSVLTRQTIEHSRQRIRDYELEMLARK